MFKRYEMPNERIEKQEHCQIKKSYEIAKESSVRIF